MRYPVPLALVVGALAALRGPGAATARPDPAAEVRERVAVSLVVARETAFVGEVVPVTLRLDVDEAWLAAHGVRSGLRAVDLPLRVVAPAPATPPTFARLAEGVEPPYDGRTLSFAWGDRIVVGRARAGGPGRTLVDATLRIVPTGAGRIDLAAPRGELVVTSGFDEDLVAGRVPRDRTTATLQGAAARLEVLAVPPSPDGGASGPVGVFRLAARADRDEVVDGQPFRVFATIEGDGDPAGFDPPRWPDDLVRILGVLDDRARPARTIVYEVATSKGLPSLPPLAFQAFDPTPPGAWRVVASPGIPLRILPGPPASPPPAGPRDGPGLVPSVLAGALVVLTIGGLMRRRIRVRRAREAEEALRARRDAERAAFRTRVEAGPDAARAAFAEIVASRLGAPVSVATSPDLEARLRAAGVEHALARDVAHAMEALVAAAYARDGRPAPGADALTDLRDRLAPP